MKCFFFWGGHLFTAMVQADKVFCQKTFLFLDTGFISVPLLSKLHMLTANGMVSMF